MNKKLQFVSGNVENTEITSVSLDFTPRQIVYSIEGNEIIKTRIRKIFINIVLNDDESQSETIKYLLSHTDQAVVESQIFESIDKIHVKDRTESNTKKLKPKTSAAPYERLLPPTARQQQERLSEESSEGLPF